MMSFTLQSNGASASGVNSNASFFPFPFFPPFFLAIAAARHPPDGAREGGERQRPVRTPLKIGSWHGLDVLSVTGTLFPTWLLSVNGESERRFVTRTRQRASGNKQLLAGAGPSSVLGRPGNAPPTGAASGSIGQMAPPLSFPLGDLALPPGGAPISEKSSLWV